MNVLIVPGYGDRQDYIAMAIKNWPARYGLEPRIYPFGTPGPAESYIRKWQAFEKKLQQVGPTGMIGLSFGVGIGLRALQDHPDLVSSVVCISGPHALRDMNQNVVNAKYPLLKASLPAFSVDALPLDRVMTLRPLRDNVVAPDKVVIPGATNKRMPIVGHGLGLLWALRFEAKAIAQFIQGHAA